MITRRHRFHGYNALKKLYTRSRYVREASIGLRYSKRNGDKPYRIAVSVGRKVSKSAVVRNKIRRRVFEAIRQKVNIPKSYDLAFYIYDKSIADNPNDELLSLLNNLISKIK